MATTDFFPFLWIPSRGSTSTTTTDDQMVQASWLTKPTRPNTTAYLQPGDYVYTIPQAYRVTGALIKIIMLPGDSSWGTNSAGVAVNQGQPGGGYHWTGQYGSTIPTGVTKLYFRVGAAGTPVSTPNTAGNPGQKTWLLYYSNDVLPFPSNPFKWIDDGAVATDPNAPVGRVWASSGPVGPAGAANGITYPNQLGYYTYSPAYGRGGTVSFPGSAAGSTNSISGGLAMVLLDANTRLIIAKSNLSGTSFIYGLVRSWFSDSFRIEMGCISGGGQTDPVTGKSVNNNGLQWWINRDFDWRYYSPPSNWTLTTQGNVYTLKFGDNADMTLQFTDSNNLAISGTNNRTAGVGDTEGLSNLSTWRLVDSQPLALGRPYSARPATSDPGNIYYPTDRPGVNFYNGKAWEEYPFACTGMVVPYAGTAAPPGWLFCYGQAVSRTTYANLFLLLNPVYGPIGVSISNPAIITSPQPHNMVTGDPFYLGTTGTLPTGIAKGTYYYAIVLDANTLCLATSPINAINNVRVASSGSQSGVHYMSRSPFGVGDGTTTFNLPDLRGRVAAGADTMGGVAAGNITNGLFSAFTGEQAHTLTIAEMPSHNHNLPNVGGGPGGVNLRQDTAGGGVLFTANTGGNAAHNIIQPTMMLNYMIRT